MKKRASAFHLMKKLLPALLLAIPCIAGLSQTLSKNDPLKFDADYYLMEKDFNRALTAFNTILKSEPDNANIKYKAGICYLNSEDNKDMAIHLLEDASQKVSEKHDPNSFKETSAPVEALFLLGSAYRVNNQIDKAMESYYKYKAYLDPHDEYNQGVVDQYLKSCELAKTMQKKPVNITATNLGREINNAAPNFNAVMSGDGNTMMYTTPGKEGYDIFISTLSDSVWTSPRNITAVLGTGKYMKPTDLSNDGLTLLLTLDDPMNADIFISHFRKGRWTKAEAMGKEINSKFNETHASFSADGKSLYFTSDRKGGYGDMDIYKSDAGPDNSWGKAVNLGDIINTPFNEETPFLAETGDKLFFSSEGHQSIGGYDIFYYDFGNPAAGVVNLGYPLNTSDNDLFFVPTGDGTTAIFACRGEDSYGGRDIYRIEMGDRGEEELAATAAVGEKEEEALADAAAAAVDEKEEKALAATAAAAVGERDEDELAAAVTVGEKDEDELAAAVTVGEKDEEELAAAVAVGEKDEEELAGAVAAEGEEEVVLTEVLPEEVKRELEAAVIDAVKEAGVAERNPQVSYEIQIMALKKPVDFRHFPDLSGVVVDYHGDTWYRYTLGNTTSLSEAENILSSVIDKGYKDAFIRRNTISAQFTIQVMAVPGPVVDLNRFSNLPDISVKRGTDEFCRYTTGEFGNKNEAMASLTKVASLGYRKAFVRMIP